jgi:hypothetical protein
MANTNRWTAGSVSAPTTFPSGRSSPLASGLRAADEAVFSIMFAGPGGDVFSDEIAAVVRGL